MAPRPALRTTRHRTVATAAASVVALVLAVGCSSDGGDADDEGATAQAVEQLEAFGLEADQAACVVDELGPAAVVEADDLTALAQSQTYQDAAAACTGDG